MWQRVKNFTQDYIKEVAIIHAGVVDGWSERGLQADIDNALSHSFVLVDEKERVLAFCSFSICGEGELVFVCTHPEQRQKGYAYSLLKEVISNIQAESLGLEVRSQNKGAIELYKKLGFTQIGIRKNMYENPIDDGIVMQRLKADG